VRNLDDITDDIIDAAIQIHRDLGPGLLESVYEALFARALEKRGLHVERQAAVRFEYDGLVFDEASASNCSSTSAATRSRRDLHRVVNNLEPSASPRLRVNPGANATRP